MMNLMHHDAEILDQFTRQAEPFLRRHENSHQGLLQLMVDCADVRRQDTVLDIACGPGIVSCFFAQHAGKAGVDRDDYVEFSGWRDISSGVIHEPHELEYERQRRRLAGNQHAHEPER